jgi:hypothetical protein
MKGLLGRAVAKLKNAFTKKNDVRRPNTHTSTSSTDAKPYERIARDLTRYVYLNPGLNRHERRSLEAKIRRSKFKRTKNDPPKITNRVEPAERKTARMMLSMTPTNTPKVGKDTNNNPLYVSKRNPVEAVSAS